MTILQNPFEPENLWLESKALLHRSGKMAATDKVQIGDLRVDLLGMHVEVNEQAIELSPKEYELLIYF